MEWLVRNILVFLNSELVIYLNYLGACFAFMIRTSPNVSIQSCLLILEYIVRTVIVNLS